MCLCKPPSHRRQRLTGVSCHSSVSRLRWMQRAAKATLQPSQPSSSDQPSLRAGSSKGHRHTSKDAMWSWSEIFVVLRRCRLGKKKKKKRTEHNCCRLQLQSNTFSQGGVLAFASLRPRRLGLGHRQQAVAQSPSVSGDCRVFSVSDLAADHLVHTPLIT